MNNDEIESSRTRMRTKLGTSRAVAAAFGGVGVPRPGVGVAQLSFAK